LNLANTFEANPADDLKANPANKFEVNPAHALEVNLHHDSNGMTSCFHARDRDITADSLLEGKSDVDLAGQASPESNKRHGNLNPSSARNRQYDNQFGITQDEIIGIYNRTMQVIENKTHNVNTPNLAINIASKLQNEIEINLRNVDLGMEIESDDMQPANKKFLHQLQRIIDDENTELRTMETHLDNASGIILMLQESSQTYPRECLMRIINDDIEHQQEKKQNIGQDEHDYYDLEREQMLDDIRHEENAATDRIIESFGGLFHDGGSDSDEND
jgi:hypothetical protein